MPFPDEYDAALSQNPGLRNEKMGTCGLKYFPFRDGPAMLMELKIDGEWIPVVSELLPEHIADRFKQAQAEWYQVLRTDSAQSVKMRILHNATNPSVLFPCGRFLRSQGRWQVSLEGVLRGRVQSSDTGGVGAVFH